MKKKSIDSSLFKVAPRSRVLDAVLDLLLEDGNELATPYRWGSNPTGYFSVLKRAINFKLIKDQFDLPASIVLDELNGVIDYGYGTVVISFENGISEVGGSA